MIGKRCMLNSHKGTVRYEGELPGTEGTWYGIEWDVPRGKHNGSLHGVQYFECKDKHGSFVKPNKVDFGVTFIEAVYSRYGSEYVIPEEDLYVRGDLDQVTMVKAVGFDKIEKGEAALIKLTDADLSDMALSSAGDIETNKSKAIRKLNLSKNLLSSWEEVMKITTALPHLRLFNLSENSISTHSEEMPNQTCPQVDEMLFNFVHADCDVLTTVLTYFPGIKQLHFCFNNLSNIRGRLLLYRGDYYSSAKMSTFTNLELINFEGNNISSWDDIMQFSKLPNLKVLILSDNKIDNIMLPDDGSAFVSLKSFSMNRNLIKDWASVNCLNHLKCLYEIRLRENPVVNEIPALDARLQLIARLKKVITVNGSPVGRKERQTAELTYLKEYSKEWHNNVKNKALDDASVIDFTLKLPNYLDYVLDYGAPLCEVQIKGSTLADKLILLKFKCKDSSVQNDSMKKVPVTMTVLQLKALLQRLFKIRQIEQTLAKYDDLDKIEIPLDDNFKQLSYYGMTHDDIVIVKKKMKV